MCDEWISARVLFSHLAARYSPLSVTEAWLCERPEFVWTRVPVLRSIGFRLKNEIAWLDAVTYSTNLPTRLISPAQVKEVCLVIKN